MGWLLAGLFFTDSTPCPSWCCAELRSRNFRYLTKHLRVARRVTAWSGVGSGGGASLVAQSVKNPPTDAGDLSLIPESRRSPGEGNGNPLQDSCLEKSHRQRSLEGYSPWGRKESDTSQMTNPPPPVGGGRWKKKERR